MMLKESCSFFAIQHRVFISRVSKFSTFSEGTSNCGGGGGGGGENSYSYSDNRLSMVVNFTVKVMDRVG